jgi:hypothetical protein
MLPLSVYIAPTAPSVWLVLSIVSIVAMFGIAWDTTRNDQRGRALAVSVAILFVLAIIVPYDWCAGGWAEYIFGWCWL